jgi:hypothetical protein
MRTKENIMRIVFAAAMLACASGANASEDGLTVEAGSAGIAVEMTRFDPELCVLTLAPKGKTFVLKAQSKSPTGWFRKGCEASFKVAAPAGPPVRVETGAGSTLFDGLSGRIQAHAEASNGALVKS